MNVSVEEAAEILKRGGIVAIPTETVYGLAAGRAARICRQKQAGLQSAYLPYAGRTVH